MKAIDEIREKVAPDVAKVALKEREATLKRVLADAFLSRDLEELNSTLTPKQREDSLAGWDAQIRALDELITEVQERLGLSDDTLLGKNRAARRRLAKAAAKNGAKEEVTA